MARLLVTGGAGFLGSHLCGRLVELGHQVVCADNFSTGSRDNIRQLLTVPAFELIEHDVTLPLDLDVDGIYHL
ncbi:MAG: NAD-dependent epimerase/dehydratase family protein, partial [Mesorhizobium sp.]